MKEIIQKIEEYLDVKTQESAFKIFKILDDEESVLKEMVEEDEFKCSFKAIEDLAYDDEENWNTNSFKRDYDKIVPMIVFKLKKALTESER